MPNLTRHETNDPRLAELQSYGILDTPPEAGFDDIVGLATLLCDAPVALVSFVDSDRQWFKARKGFDPCQTNLESSVCRHVLGMTQILEVPDLTKDPRTANNPLVVDAPHIRFYAGAPLITSNGHTLGTLCVLDHIPRPQGLTEPQRGGLEALARQVIMQLELRKLATDRTRMLAERIENQAQYQEVSEKLAAAQRAGGVGLFTLDIATNMVKGTQEFSRTFGLEHLDERPAQELESLVIPMDDMLVSHEENRRTGEAPTDVEYRIRKADTGEIRWIARKGDFQFDDSGRPVGFIGVTRDITARRQVEEKLRKAQETLELALDVTEMGTFDYDLVADTLVWDDRCRTLFGLPPDADVDYQTFLTGLHPDDQERTHEAVKAAIDPQGDGIFDVEYRTIGLVDGVERWVAAKGKTFFHGTNALRFIGTVRDITRAGEAQRRLREAEERYRFASRATNDAIWDWDFETNFVLWNEALTTAYGHEPDRVEPTGAWWIDHIHPDDRQRIDHSIHAVIDGTATEWTDGYRFKRADGTYAPVFDRGHVIRDEQGRPRRMIGAMLDLTRLQKAEAELLESQKQLHVERGLLEAVVQQAPIGISIIYADGHETFNTRLEQMFGQQVTTKGGVLSLGVLVPDAAEAERLIEHQNERGENRRYEVTTTPVRDHSGGILATLALVIDVEDRKQAEERRALLNRELSHRLKNSLAIVQSIVSQTLRSAPDVKSAQRTLAPRINALATAHETLLTGHRDAALVAELVRSATSIHAGSDRISAKGPDVLLGPQASLALSLVLHELSTNALKYGALSVAEGRVDISWSVEGASPDTPKILRFTWTEEGGPLVTAPQQRGFGTRLIEIGLGAGQRASQIDYRPEGLHYEAEAELSALEAK